jgi:hypothetical protein
MSSHAVEGGLRERAFSTIRALYFFR